MFQSVPGAFTLGKWVLPFGGELPLDISIRLDGEECRRSTDDGLPIYVDCEAVKGQIVVHPRPGTMVEHTGVRVEFVGSCELIFDRSNSLDFVSLVRHVAGPGTITKPVTYDFEFLRVEKSHDSYHGHRTKLSYLLKAMIVNRRSQAEAARELWVHKEYDGKMDPNPRIGLELGIEDALHLECKYLKSKYHLNDVVIGSVHFLLVRIKIKMVELTLIKREASGIGRRRQNYSETIARFEIMDGVPVKGESIPIRLFLGAYGVGPTMQEVCRRFSVSYYLNLVLVDEHDRRYFKQEEIILYRKAPGSAHSRQQAKGVVASGELLQANGTESEHLPAGAVVDVAESVGP